MNERLKVGVSGFGYWGSKLARNIQASPHAELTIVCDPSEQNRAAAEAFSSARTTADYGELLENVDAVVCAAPSALHHSQGRDALLAGKHVSIEKPITLSTGEAAELVELAAARSLQLMSGHTFLYSPAVEVALEIISSGQLGKVLYGYSQRLSLGAFRKDIDAVWDLAPHDISIFLHLMQCEPVRASCRKHSFLDGSADVGFSAIEFSDGASAHIHSSRLDPRRVRMMTFVGEQAMMVYDDADVREPVKIYESSAQLSETVGRSPAGESLKEYSVQFSQGPTTAPLVPSHEPMRQQMEDFFAAIREGRPPRSDGELGTSVVRLLEAFDRSHESDGSSQQL